jgi:hypothetical protein
MALAGGPFAAVALPGPVFAQDACPAPRPAIPRIQILNPDPLVNTTQSIAWISDRLRRNARGWQRDPRLDRFIHALGLTVVQWGTDISVAGLAGPRGGRQCFVATELHVRFGLQAHLVFIAREIPRGSCLWRDVHAHEMRHVGVNRESIRAAASLLTADVETLARQGISAEGPTVEAAQQQVLDRLRAAVRRAEQAFDQRSTRGHASIDTPEEYERASRACGGEAQRLLRRLSSSSLGAVTALAVPSLPRPAAAAST